MDGCLCECFVFSRRGLCEELITRPEESYGCLSVVSFVCCQVEFSAPELITRPEESYRLRCVAVCVLDTSRMRRPWPALGRWAVGPQEILQLSNKNNLIF